MRKIIHIAAAGYARPHPSNGYFGGLFALCDDGTVWWLNAAPPGEIVVTWEKCPEIPQDDRDMAST